MLGEAFSLNESYCRVSHSAGIHVPFLLAAIHKLHSIYRRVIGFDPRIPVGAAFHFNALIRDILGAVFALTSPRTLHKIVTRLTP
ncbi:hypothetical protein M413DRAFT_323986 [Hebeloma cylindrosporum]|uniref:Uncharacterized protein n=1 Tax=Hebeloma cylindrosporum TaxID=76867 RepID=A0A0C3BWU8_HEBCY|nr:hypothetical protein M413DRAFT_323986 [Hebeloma cylindrosporum h7]